MSTPGINQNIALTGEKEYRDAIKNINASLGVLKSEMALTSERFKDNADSVEALTARNDVLGRSIDAQNKKIETLKAALKEASDAFGENDEKTAEWQEKLNYAQADLLKMERELKNNTDAIKSQTEALEEQTEALEEQDEALEESTGNFLGFGDAVSSAADKLGVNLPQGAVNSMNSLGNLDMKTVAVIGGFAALAAAVIKAEKALYDLTAQAAASADEIMSLSMQTGLSTKALQEFSYASELIDVSLDTLQGSLSKLTNNMQTAMKGTGDAAAAFEQLGVSVSDTNGNMRRAQDVFYEAIDTLGEMENATERDALAMDIFGKSAQELNPLIIAGSGALRDLAKEANETGYVLDDFALAKLGAVDDALQRLENSRETFTKNLAVQFAPTMEKSLGNMEEMINRVGDALEKSGAVEAFGSILESTSMLLVPLGELISSALPVLTPMLNAVAWVVALIADTLTVISGVLKRDLGMIKQGLGMTGNSAQNKLYGNSRGWTYDNATGTWKDPSVVTMADKRSQYDDWTRSGGAGTFEYWEQSIYGRNAAGTPNWRGGWSWVGENGPELAYLPQGSQVKTAQESRGAGGGDVFYITIDAKNVKEFNDLVRMAQEARMKARKGSGQ